MICHLLVLGLLLQAGGTLADTIEGRVTGVSGGDTITVLDGTRTTHRIRLAGIDAPKSAQAFGPASRKHLADLVLDKAVRVEWKRHDAYGYVLGKVMVPPPDCPACPPTLDAGLAQLEAGLAWWYREFRREQTLEDQGYYEYAEFDAKARRVGLWSDAHPVPPWEWRKRNHVVACLSLPRAGFLAGTGAGRRRGAIPA